MMDQMPSAGASSSEEQEALIAAKRRWIATQLQNDCDDLVRKWNPIHMRMIDDERQYEGIDNVAPTKDNSASGEGTREVPNLKITQSRTTIAAARLGDMVFPHADQPWDIAPDDDPHIPEEDVIEAARKAGDPNAPEPLSPEQVRAILAERADEHRKVTKDQFAETRAVQKCRRMIEDASRIGWGVVKGPVMGVRRKKRHKGSIAADGSGKMMLVSVTEVTEESRPELQYVDPWRFVADLAPTIDEAERGFEFHLMSNRDLRELTSMPGFDEDAVKRLIKQKPTNVAECPILATYATKNSKLGLSENLRDVYVVTEYNGPIRKEWAEEQTVDDGLGGTQTVFCCDALTIDGQPFTWVEDGSPLPMVQVFFCQGEVLKFKEAPLENDTRLPYYVYTFARIDDTFAGGGIPYLMRSMDRAVQACWKMGLHNASVSSGPLVFLKRKHVTSADGRNAVRGPKTYYVDSDAAMKDLVHVQIIDNNTQQYMAMLDKALALSDEILNMPLIAQGSQTAVTQTASGLAMQLNAQNVFQKRLAMNLEDSVIVPLLERWIEWNICYGDPQRFGGEFKVVPRTNALLVKDMQAQRFQALTVMAADPRFALYVDNYGLFKKNCELLEVDTDGILLPEQQAREREAAAQQQQPDPMIAIKEQELALKDKKIETDAQIAQGDQELRQVEIQSKQEIAQMGVDQAYAKLALDENITLADIETKITQIREAEATKRQKIGADARIEAEKMVRKEASDALQVKVEKPVRLAG